MKLWLLEWVGGAYGWDKAWGFVVAAPDEQIARNLAQVHGGDETYSGNYRTRAPFWTDPKLASCVPLLAESFTKAQVILRDFNAG